MASAAIVAQPAGALRQLRSIQRIQAKFILGLRKVGCGVRWTAAPPGLRFSIMRKRWRLAPWRLRLQVRPPCMLAPANLIHAAIVSLGSDSIELITRTLPRPWLVPLILHKLSAILLTT